jgi:single-stranded-DNA-specific exonuclease
MTQILERKIPQRAVDMLAQSGLHPMLARLYAARGITRR